MPFQVEQPCWARAVGFEGKEGDLERHLTYTDLRVGYEIKRFEKNRYYRQVHGEEAFTEELQRLKALRKKCLLRRGPDGSLWVPSGSVHELANRLNDYVQDLVPVPAEKGMVWAKALDRSPRKYQADSVEKLIEARHGGVELATGLGKTLIILMLLKRLGLPALVTSPFGAIAQQTFREAQEFLGKKYVGLYGAGRKDYKKLITISTAQALHKVQPNSDVGQHLRGKVKVFIFDESHMTAADTLSHVCLNLMSDAPYRFFLSGTQLRNDGLQPLLDGITGPILLRMTLEDGVNAGYLARPAIRIVEVPGTVWLTKDDPGTITREAVLQNPKVVAAAAGIANQMVAQGRPTLILVDELHQFARLQPYLKYEAKFAHAGAGDSMKKSVPQPFWDSDPLALVDEFNDGKFPILVGTSCISTGVDVRIPRCGIWLRGGKSEVELRQGVGRMVRMPGDKKEFIWVDFDVVDVELATKHTNVREDIYRKIWTHDVKRIRLT